MQEIVDAMDGQPGDLILICADKDKGRIRLPWRTACRAEQNAGADKAR